MEALKIFIHRRPLVAIGIVLLIPVIITMLLAGLTHRGSQVTLKYNIKDLSDVSVLFNGKVAQPTQGTTYALSPGTYVLLVSKPHYSNFSTEINVSSGKRIAVDVTLNPAAQPTANTGTSTTPAAQPAVPIAIDIPDFTPLETHYFDNQTWAVLIGNMTDGTTGVAIVQYDAVGITWNIILQPGAPFDAVDMKGIPADVQNYMKTNGYVLEGD